MKPGIKTSEFWVTLIVSVLGPLLTILAMMGVISFEDVAEMQESLTTATTEIGKAVALIVANIASAWTAIRYTQQRTSLKANYSDD